ncbi:hypothetical protein M0R45_000607 [Rubus argutus]|uniref:Ubiquitin-like protease family profile domain-containing protein n=1 Tax=Rubus argutus TaxID=59490 RepID=A0AAW1VPF4_RUBAR
MTRQLCGVKRMSKAILEQKIKNVAKLRGNEDERDFVRLVCLYFCVTLFLCNSGNELGWNVVPYIEDIETMSQYAWAPLVTDHLLESIFHMNDRPESSCGCVIALLFWFCERTHFIEPIRGREHLEPKILKWNLPELYARMKVVSIQEMEVREKDEKQSTNNTPYGVKHSIEIGTTSDTKSLGEAPNIVDDFDPSKMFQLLPSQFYLEESQEGPSENVSDIPELKRRLQESIDLLEIERARNKTLSEENSKLRKEVVLLRQANSKDEIPIENLRKLRTKEQCKKPSVLEDYIVDNMKGRRGKEKIKIDNNDDAAVQEPPAKKEKKQKTVQQIGVRRLRVGKYMTKGDAEKLKESLSKNSGNCLWIGVHSRVTNKDASGILHEEAISRQVLDAYLEILSRHQHSMMEGGITSYFMPTFSWNVRDKEFIFLPIIHENDHFTLLVLNKRVGFWEHYNTMRPKRATTLDPCFVEAAKLHVEITNHFTFLKSHAKSIIKSGFIWKHVIRRGEVKLFQFKLSNEDRDLLIWLGGNFVDHFPIRSKKECPQQDSGSMDCGIGVMYIVKKLSEGEAVESTFNKGAMTSMRAHILGRLINEPNGV